MKKLHDVIVINYAYTQHSTCHKILPKLIMSLNSKSRKCQGPFAMQAFIESKLANIKLRYHQIIVNRSDFTSYVFNTYLVGPNYIL